MSTCIYYKDRELTDLSGLDLHAVQEMFELHFDFKCSVFVPVSRDIPDPISTPTEIQGLFPLLSAL